jgi:hypothetical protein
MHLIPWFVFCLVVVVAATQNLCDLSGCGCSNGTGVCVSYWSGALRAEHLRYVYLVECDTLSLAAARAEQRASVSCVNVSGGFFNQFFFVS